jgi:hypothetical protein
MVSVFLSEQEPDRAGIQPVELLPGTPDMADIAGTVGMAGIGSERVPVPGLALAPEAVQVSVLGPEREPVLGSGLGLAPEPERVPELERALGPASELESEPFPDILRHLQMDTNEIQNRSLHLL